MPDLLERLRAALADRYAVESEIGRGGMQWARIRGCHEEWTIFREAVYESVGGSEPACVAVRSEEG